MQTDVRRAMSKGCVDHGSGNLAGLGGGHRTTGTERAEVDVVPKCLGGGDRRCDVGAGVAFDKRFDRELQQQHETGL